MNDLEDFLKQSFDSFVEGVNCAFEETQKKLQDAADQAQTAFDELIREGEAKYNEWFAQQSYSSQPRWEVRQRLFTLVHGNWELAERLLSTVRRNHPGRSEDWYWEKVIYDLERDR